MVVSGLVKGLASSEPVVIGCMGLIQLAKCLLCVFLDISHKGAIMAL